MKLKTNSFMEKMQPLFLRLLSMTILLLACFFQAEGRDVLLTNNKIIFNKKKVIQVLPDEDYSFHQAKKKAFKAYHTLSGKLNPKEAYWAKYDFKAKDTNEYYFYFGKAEYLTVYVSKNGGDYIKKEIGSFTPRSQTDVKDRPRSAKIDFKAGETARVYVRFQNKTNFSPRISLKVAKATTFHQKEMFERLSWQALFHGAIWIMILYNFFLWTSVGDRAYLYYAAYMFILSFTFFLHDKIHYQVFTFLAEYPQLMYFLETIFAQLAIVMYFLFMHKMVGTKQLVPFWHKISFWWVCIKVVTLPFLVWYNTYKIADNSIVYVLMAIDLTLLLLTCLILLFKKDKVATYFSLGSILLALCGLASILQWQGIVEIPMLEKMVQIGIIAQIIVFSMGLGFKTRRSASLVFELQKQNENLVTQLKNKVNEQEKTLRLFMRYVPEPVVAKALNQGSDEDYFGGEMRYVTALFCDVRDFTSISEELEPKQVVAFLNDFYSVMTIVIKKYGGSVNQFIGDEIFAVFGAPLATSNNEQRATLAALEMIEKVKYLNEKYQAEFRRPIRVGIGLNAGEVIAGNLGSEEKIEYSVIGDAVNTAKRIEGLTKSKPNSIIISETVYKKVAPLITVESLNEVMLKGKRDITKAYRVLNKK